MQTTRAILFDVDGVLVDATDWHFESFNRALEPFDVAISGKQHQEEFLGLPTAIKINRLVERGALPTNACHAVALAKRKYFREIVRKRCQPLDIDRHLLGVLKDNGFILAAVSNAVRESVTEMLELSGLLKYLAAVVCGDDVLQGHTKPHPEIYLSCSRVLGIRPDQCLAVEDGNYGIRSARAAGMRVLTVNSKTEVNLANILAAVER